MLRFRRMKTLRKFASVHANVDNHFNLERHMVDRQTFKVRRQPHLLSGSRSPAERRTQSPSCIAERRVRTRLTAPDEVMQVAEGYGPISRTGAPAVIRHNTKAAIANSSAATKNGAPGR